MVAYSLYKLSVTPDGGTTTTLHRSNAIHQPRRRQLDTLTRVPEDETDEMDQQLAGGGPLVPVDTHSEDHESIAPAETEESIDMAGSDAPNQGVRGLLFYIAEDNAARRAYIHRGIRCEGCGEFPILGTRYHCLNCPDFDLCATCEAHSQHVKNHIFAKIKIPLSLLSQPPKPIKLWYAGDPQKIHDSLDLDLRKQLCRESGFDEAELDALYDQFTCIANVPWPADPTRIGAAIDRRAFNKTMSSERWANRFAPNVLLDRMFAFYDTDGNSLIGFREFIGGMEYLRGSNRFSSLRRALQGFDMDGDQHVTRADFMRVLRAKFEMQQQLIIDATQGFEERRTQGATAVLRSSQPISSVFNQEEIPQGRNRVLHGKQMDTNGDLMPMGNEKTILDDDEPFFGNGARDGAERLLNAFDRFEDLLLGAESVDGPDVMDGSNDLPDDAQGSLGDGSAGLYNQLRASLVDGGTDSSSGLQISLSEHLADTPEPEPYVQDLLWHYKEAGLKSLLDPLFSKREEVERRAVATREARTRWREAIDRFKTEQEQNEKDRQKQESLSNGTLLAGEPPHRFLARGIVPTDDKSLEQLEIERANAPLDALLEVSGYGIREDPEEPAAVDSQTTDSSADELADASRPVNPASGMDVLSTDPVRNDDGTERTPANCAQEHNEAPPSSEILKLWVRLDEVDREIRGRGDLGRLSLAEVESIVVEKELREVRGLIKSWLEWAAF